jgi:hypothetical protein
MAESRVGGRVHSQCCHHIIQPDQRPSVFGQDFKVVTVEWTPEMIVIGRTHGSAQAEQRRGTQKGILESAKSCRKTRTVHKHTRHDAQDYVFGSGSFIRMRFGIVHQIFFRSF